MKINDFNKDRRDDFISSLEDVHNLTRKNEKLYNQVFRKFNLIQIFEIDETEKRTLIELTTLKKELNPKLRNAKYLYPPVNENIFNEYLEILKLEISDEEKICKIRSKQLKELLITIALICSFILILIYLAIYA